ncbi:MAG: glutamine amidotransferase [Leptothrix sp. (in: Bacteria)]|nr:glutamine amidotransferase [Leptothrix sp. (in: b-proteobacteria)]
MKTLVALRHLAFEDLGLLEPLLRAQGWRVHYYDLGVDELWKLDLDQVDLLVILGGPIGAEEDERYPFLAEEVLLLSERMATRRPMLGICLGAQLIARAMGARVRPMGHKEIGYAAITLTARGEGSPLAAIGNQPVLHWHGDQFDLPAGIESLATTPLCPNQAFMVEDHTLAWQFHLEVNAARVEQWLVGHAAELAQVGIPTQRLRDEAAKHGPALDTVLSGVMRQWLSGLPL